MASMLALVSMVIVVSMATHAVSFTISVQYKNENDLTCYTCPNKGNNRECNRWAPERFCLLNHTVCKTVHRINRHTGDSVEVNKMCAQPEQCQIDNIGCVDTENKDEIECVSCCNFSYCNIEVPVNLTSTLQLSASIFGSSVAPTLSFTNWPIVAAAGVTWYTTTTQFM